MWYFKFISSFQYLLVQNNVHTFKALYKYNIWMNLHIESCCNDLAMYYKLTKEACNFFPSESSNLFLEAATAFES